MVGVSQICECERSQFNNTILNSCGFYIGPITDMDISFLLLNLGLGTELPKDRETQHGLGKGHRFSIIILLDINNQI